MVFFTARILEVSHEYNIESELLRAMHAKLSYRLLKLGEENSGPWIDDVEHVIIEPNDLPSTLDVVPEKYQGFVLAVFDHWVDLHLPRWLNLHVGEETTCGQLKDSIKRHRGVARSNYAENPEVFFIMFFTIMEL